jgi:hypothetical protein
MNILMLTTLTLCLFHIAVCFKPITFAINNKSYTVSEGKNKSKEKVIYLSNKKCNIVILKRQDDKKVTLEFKYVNTTIDIIENVHKAIVIKLLWPFAKKCIELIDLNDARSVLLKRKHK